MDKIRNILVAVDLNAGSEAVAGVAAGFAEAFSAKLYFLHVERDNPTIFGDPDIPDERDQAAGDVRTSHRELQELREKMTPPGVEAAALQIKGQTVQKIIACRLLLMCRDMMPRKGITKWPINRITSNNPQLLT